MTYIIQRVLSAEYCPLFRLYPQYVRIIYVQYNTDGNPDNSEQNKMCPLDFLYCEMLVMDFQGKDLLR